MKKVKFTIKMEVTVDPERYENDENYREAIEYLRTNELRTDFHESFGKEGCKISIVEEIIHQ